MEDGIGYAEFLRMVVALVFVLSLILLALFLVKRYGKGWGFQHIPLARRRLKIVEAIPVGPKQRLMIVQRDNKEHLLIVGHESATIIEKDIEAGPIHKNNEASEE